MLCISFYSAQAELSKLSLAVAPLELRKEIHNIYQFPPLVLILKVLCVILLINCSRININTTKNPRKGWIHSLIRTHIKVKSVIRIRNPMQNKALPLFTVRRNICFESIIVPDSQPVAGYSSSKTEHMAIKVPGCTVENNGKKSLMTLTKCLLM